MWRQRWLLIAAAKQSWIRRQRRHVPSIDQPHTTHPTQLGSGGHLVDSDVLPRDVSIIAWKESKNKISLVKQLEESSIHFCLPFNSASVWPPHDVFKMARTVSCLIIFAGSFMLSCQNRTESIRAVLSSMVVDYWIARGIVETFNIFVNKRKTHDVWTTGHTNNNKLKQCKLCHTVQ